MFIFCRRKSTASPCQLHPKQCAWYSYTVKLGVVSEWKQHSPISNVPFFFKAICWDTIGSIGGLGNCFFSYGANVVDVFIGVFVVGLFE